MRRTRSSVTRSKSRTLLLYSGGLPAATITQPAGTAWLPKVLHCKNCSMVGASVSDTQLISSINKIPCSRPVCSILSYTLAMISLIVYSVTLRSAPPKLRWRINGRPTALWRVWWVMVYATSAMPHSCAICSMIWVLPTPGGPISRIGRWRMGGISGVPVSSTARYALTACSISCLARLMSMGVHSFIKTLGTNKMNYNSGRSSASFSCQSISGVLGTGSGKNSSGLKTSRMAQGGVSGGGVPVSKNRKAVS